jgi:hypothetical protein
MNNHAECMNVWWTVTGRIGSGRQSGKAMG